MLSAIHRISPASAGLVFLAGLAAMAAGLSQIAAHAVTALGSDLCGAAGRMVAGGSMLAGLEHCWGCPLALAGLAAVLLSLLAALPPTSTSTRGPAAA